MGTMVSQITRLTIVYSDADQGDIKGQRHWSLCGEFTGDRWILPPPPPPMASNVSIWWSHHASFVGILFTKKTSWHGSLFHITEPSCFCGQSAANQLCVDVFFLLLARTSCVTKSWDCGNLTHDHMTSVWCWVGIYKNHLTLIEIWFPYRSHSWYLP